MTQNNLNYQFGAARSFDRDQWFGHRPQTFWLTGLSGAGKTTLAYQLERELLQAGHASCVLDGDNIRQGLSRDLGYLAEDRAENIRRIAEVSRLMNDAGLMVITSFISPYRADREIAREIIGADRFNEIWVSTDISVCEFRDIKGLYKKARDGLITDFTGISSPYEAPLDPKLSIDTSQTSLAESISQLMKLAETYYL